MGYTEMNNLAKKLSITAGLITAFSLAYVGISPIWGLPFAPEIQQTAAVLVVLMSGILSAFTGQKILSNKNQDDNVVELKELADTNQKMADAGVFKGIADVEDIEKNIPDDIVTKHAEFEQEGGQGAVYSVPVGDYEAFRSAVINRGFDIDGVYGFQCWDGAALLWQQLGRSLSTGGTGAAKGCWQNARTQNAGDKFDLIGSANDLKRGDVVVFAGGQYGHIGFVDSVNGDGTVNLLGQNQTGTGSGAPFNVIRMSLANFIGAFRLKSWNVARPVVPQPEAPKPQAPIQRVDFEDKPQIGDRVITVADLDQNGTRLNKTIINDGNSIFTEINGKGNAVLRKGGVVRCGVPVDSLRKVL